MTDELKRFAGNPDFVLSLARGLRLIEAFHDLRDGASVAELAVRTGLSRAAVRRFLITLELLGYAAQSGSVYRLNSRILRLGYSYLSSTSLPALALPILEDISATVHESCSISTLEGDEIVYLARSAVKRVMTVGLSVGSRLPAYCTSMGRVLLAGLPKEELDAYLRRVELKAHTRKTITGKGRFLKMIRQVRGDGFALVDEELEIGLRSLAVPVHGRGGKVIAAMNTGVHASRVAPSEMTQRFLPVLRSAAKLLEQALG